MRSRHLALASALVFAAVGVAGCGGSDNAVAPPVIPTTTAATGSTPTTPHDVLGVINANPQLSQFAHAVQISGLTSSLTGTNPVTVFAPSNAAIAKLGSQWAVMQSSAHAAALARQLAFHVVLGSYPLSELTDGELLTTVQGDRLRVVFKHGDKYLKTSHGQARILGEGTSASNGDVIVVSRLLSPPTKR